MLVIFIGLPGSGKGTQARKFKDKTNIAHFAAGDFLRNYSKNNEEIRKIITAGYLVDDETARRLFFKEIHQLKDNVIIDGFPRTMSQFHYFINEFGVDIVDAVIFLQVPEKILIDRILKRWFCNICQTTFSAQSICCNEQTVKRPDDTSMEIIKTRLETNRKETHDILSAFQQIIPNKTHIIQGDAAIADVYNTIFKIINK